MISLIGILRQKSVVVLGAGLTGCSVSQYLINQGVDFVWSDSCEALSERAVALSQSVHCLSASLGERWLAPLGSADVVIASPGIAPELWRDHCASEASVFSDIDLFVDAYSNPIIGITGSNGKSTVTALTAHLLAENGISVAMGGNIGVPVLDLLDDEPDVAVLEISSFQLDIIASLPLSKACILNITPDHMDRYKSFAEYKASKQRIYRESAQLMFSAEHTDTIPRAEQNQGTRYTYGFTTEDNQQDECIAVAAHDGIYLNGDWVLGLEELPMLGKHNIENVLAALALVHDFSIAPRDLAAAITCFEPLTHRMQLVAEINGVRWINDSKATNVGATEAAIRGICPSVKGRLILLVGGESKDADLSLLANVFEQYALVVIAFGASAAAFTEVTESVKCVDSLNDACEAANALVVEGDAVLLSPACASFDQFASFEARGNAFIDFVETLKQEVDINAK